MVCTTFLHDGELNVPTSNKELNSILKEIRNKSGEDWQVVERVYNVRKHLWSMGTRKTYELYKYVGGCGPWQQINFYREDEATSINLSNSATTVIAFLYGMLAGLHCKEMKNDAR
jgi:hypothetical protein